MCIICFIKIIVIKLLSLVILRLSYDYLFVKFALHTKKAHGISTMGFAYFNTLSMNPNAYPTTLRIQPYSGLAFFLV